MNASLPQQIVSDLAKSQEASDIASAAMFEVAKSYHNTVLTVGYAGFFGIWAFSRSYLPENVSFWVGILVGASIFLYVLYEVIQMLYLQFVTVRTGILLRQPPLPRTLPELISYAEEKRLRAERVQRTVRVSGLALLAIWPFFFVPSVLMGFGGGLLLLYNSFAYLASWPFWPA